MQTAAIADQNGGKMWERQIVEIKSLLFLQVRSSREEQIEEGDSRSVSIKQPKTMFEFGLPSIIAYSPKNTTVSRSIRSCCRFLRDSLHCHFLSKA